jgi:hypothetical protein
VPAAHRLNLWSALPLSALWPCVELSAEGSIFGGQAKALTDSDALQKSTPNIHLHWLVGSKHKMALPTNISSPRLLARYAGLFSLITIVGGVVAQGLISNRLLVFSSAATTSTNILANRTLFEASFTIFLIEMAANVATTALFYELLRPVSKSMSLLGAFWGLSASTIKTFARVF